jgi:hypothetical protein
VSCRSFKHGDIAGQNVCLQGVAVDFLIQLQVLIGLGKERDAGASHPAGCSLQLPESMAKEITRRAENQLSVFPAF